MYPETKRGKAGEQGNGGIGNYRVILRVSNDTRHGVMYQEIKRGKAGEQGNGCVGNIRVTLCVSATILDMG